MEVSPNVRTCSVAVFPQMRGVVYSAILTLALSLPQGILALPIAVAQVGLIPGLLIMLLIGALNIATTTWTAQAVAAYFMRRGTVPSLIKLAHEQLGIGGGRLTLGSGAALFFLALIASIVGLARSLAELSETPALLWGMGCGLVLIALVLARIVLSARLIIGLGLLNVGLLVALLLLMLPHVHPLATPVMVPGSPLMIAGVSLLLFFVPMLVALIAQQVLPHGGSPRAFIWGSAAGVAASVVLFTLWAVGVWHITSARSLAEATSTTIPALVMAVPEARFPAMLLGLCLLGMTALRCALMLATLAEEQLPAWMAWRQRHLLAQVPAGLGVVIALALLLRGATSFTQVIALTGGGAASITSLAIPTLLIHRRSVIKRTAPAPIH